MRLVFLPFIALLSVALGCEVSSYEPSQQNPLATIDSLMQAQEQAWNEGNLEGFMSSYWNNDSLSFIGSRGLSKGWQTTLENYKKSYSNKDEMGTLLFENLEMEQLAPSAAYVVGKWTLFRNADTLSGHYSLLWKKQEDRWVIVADHSS